MENKNTSKGYTNINHDGLDSETNKEKNHICGKDTGACDKCHTAYPSPSDN